MTEYNLDGKKYNIIKIDNEIYLLDSENVNKEEQNKILFDVNNSTTSISLEEGNQRDNNVKEEKLLYFTTNYTKKESKKETIPKTVNEESKQLTKIKRKRGRKTNIKENTENKKEGKKTKIHDKNSCDNILRKIQVHYLTFIVSYLNEILKSLEYPIIFHNLNYKFKSNVKKEFVESLKTKTIGEIIVNDITIKFKTLNKNYNQMLYEKIKDNEQLKKIFEDNYLKLFKNIYYKNNNKVNLKEYGINKVINLPENVEMIKDLLKKHNDFEEKRRIKESVIKNYLPDSIFLLK